MVQNKRQQPKAKTGRDMIARLMVFLLTIASVSCKSAGIQKPEKDFDVLLPAMDNDQDVQLPAIDDEDLSQVKQANDFALRLFQLLHKDGKGMQNLVVSPLSAVTLMGIIANGAEGETLQELTTAIGMSATEANSLLPKLGQTNDEHVTLHTANLIATRPDIALRKTFTDTIRHYYPHTAVAALNLRDTKERQKIDEWCRQQTEGMVPQITNEQDTATVLLNAICFKALWEEPFDKATQPLPFENGDGTVCLLPTMSRLADMQVEQQEHYTALGLNYRGGRYKMLVLLPNVGFSIDHVLKKMTAREMALLMCDKNKNVKTLLHLPKFEMDTEQPLIPVLQQMGIRTAFTPQASFGRMTDSWLYISNVEQWAHIEVDQEGTKAAAATKASMAIGYFDDGSYWRIDVDRPFLFAIGDNETGALLFIGEYRGNDKAAKAKHGMSHFNPQHLNSDGSTFANEATTVEGTGVLAAEERVYDVVDRMPEFPGGAKALMDFIKQHQKGTGEVGRVIVTIIVEKDGRVTSPKVIRSVSPGLDADALRVISEMPHWLPGHMGVQRVRVKYTLPVTYRNE